MRLLISKLFFGLYLFGRLMLFWLKKYHILFLLTICIGGGLHLKSVLFPDYDRKQIINSSSRNIMIPRGSSLREIAEILEINQVLKHKNHFILLGKISGYQHKIQAGYFTVPSDLPTWHLLKYLSEPNVASIKVTLPEGLETTEIASILRKNLGIDSTAFMGLVFDPEICRNLGIPANHMEGYLLPETYFLNYGMDELEIIKILIRGTLSIFNTDSVQQQLEKLNMNVHKIVTMASIIEGEVVVDSERVLVSSVYHNRLKRGWHLGADPTIQYIIPGPPRRLLNEDLEIDSPYNTYKYRGLPPGPINNPGRKSILAALFPAETRYMYFVASGDGGHQFSRTAEEHAQHKANFDRIRRQVKRNSGNRR